jgi:FAD/FMN-containing dehydrogenase
MMLNSGNCSGVVSPSAGILVGMTRHLIETTATIAQASEAPALAPAVPTLDQIPFGEIGFFAVAGLWMLQYILKYSDRQSTGTWEILQRLLESQQETAKTLAKTNSELVLRLARVHERLERIERVLLDGGRHGKG